MDRSELASAFLVLGFVCLLGFETLFPNFRYRASLRWKVHALFFLASGMVLSILIGHLIEASAHAYRLIPQARPYFASLPAPLNGWIAYLTVTFFVYWWHRARHASPLLWRTFHQLHHSTHRLQAMTTFYAHPLDYLGNALIVNTVAYGLLGLDPASAAWASAWVGIFEIWEHTNIETPIWLGYFVVRPEMHRIHHELHRHQGNYGIPLWDWLFGTYENSARVVACGFAPDREARVLDMLLLRDVHR